PARRGRAQPPGCRPDGSRSAAILSDVDGVEGERCRRCGGVRAVGWTMPLTAALFDLDRVPAPLRDLLDTQRPWDVLERLDAFGASLLDDRVGTVHPTAIVEGPLVVEEGAEVGPFAYLTGPVYLAAGAHIGHAARVRGPVVLGPGAKVMHASE